MSEKSKSPYVVMHLPILKEVIVYHNCKIIFEGQPKNISKAKELLNDAFKNDLQELCNNYGKALQELQDIEIQQIKGEI